MRKSIFSILFSIFILHVNANNVQLTNITVTNNVANTAKIIHFDLSWENSWRTNSTNNWDGVWVFFKFKDNDGMWKHLNFTGLNNVIPAGLTNTMGNNGALTGVGMFIFRSANGFGSVAATDVRAGIQSYPGTFEIKGFAVEMVYIPQGSFYVGDSSSKGYRRGNTQAPYLISSNGVGVSLGTAGGNLNDQYANGYSGNLSGFPTGYSDFWIMKFELSRGAYRDFVNTLTYNQQTSLFASTSPPSSPTGTLIYGASSIFNNLEIAIPGVANTIPAVVGADFDNDNVFNESNDAEWKPVTSISWIHIAAYLDWAGLRPMTELELEKTARGPLYPVVDEFAWGTAETDTTEYIYSNLGTASEVVTNASSTSGNMIFIKTTGAPSSPFIRGGGFANSFSTRISSGAGYYGPMEISGSLLELCVSTSSTMSRSYTGKHGDGQLTTTGYANENYWPGINGISDTSQVSGVYDGGAGVRTSAGMIIRCGAWDVPSINASISYRTNGLLISFGITNTRGGIRGVRDAN